MVRDVILLILIKPLVLIAVSSAIDNIGLGVLRNENALFLSRILNASKRTQMILFRATNGQQDYVDL